MSGELQAGATASPDAQLFVNEVTLACLRKLQEKKLENRKMYLNSVVCCESKVHKLVRKDMEATDKLRAEILALLLWT